ncbi:D-glycerate dehydrogenase [Geochorda subterranea]|uniref:D-glycerate dehydrogenase n=2 Tax=Geochorda subterranea TaxID=3109564 RepID=A0ABZ1BQR1_9FIRM|nr:D-glycerate dehydrogenase [Limnochorda sp. LNt]WRP15029.1 D-glycerate dehydrogenase [Limnochorda sp. LNt]
MMPVSIFVTQPIPAPAVERLERLGNVRLFGDTSRILPREQLLREVGRCDILYCMLHDRIDAAIIDAAPRLRLIATSAVNPANVDVAHATRRGIPVTVIPNVVVEATADLQWALLLAVARRVVEADRALRAGLFPGAQSMHFVGGEVHGKVLGSIGLGAIGRAAARRARGFGMTVLYTKRTRLEPQEEAELGVAFRSLDELLRESDFVVINAALHPGTRHLVGRRELGLMKPSAYLINTARGPIVDEQALVEALKAGRIAGAALDVFEEEPAVHPELPHLSNVVLTPHIGTATWDTRLRIASIVVDNIEAFVAGRRPPNLFNAEVLGTSLGEAS